MKKVNIPESAKRKMVEFFLKTSIPRILEKKKKGGKLVGSKHRKNCPGTDPGT